MKITVEIKVCADDQPDAPLSEVITLEREVLTPSGVGLSLAEAHRLLGQVQDLVVAAQARAVLAERRCCTQCGRAHARKDTRTITMRTLFGKLHLDSPRLFTCPCQSGPRTTFSPLARVFAERSTPELVYLQARFAAVMSYGTAASLLGEVLPLGRALHPSGIRDQVTTVAQRLESELGPEQPMFASGCQREWDELPRPDLPLVVGLDGGYVHSSTQTSRRDGWFEVIAGKSMPTEGPSKCFAFVQKIDTKPKRRLFEVLRGQGMQANQAVTFFTDGGEDVRDLPLYLNPRSEHWLDWFHITMKLTVLKQMAKSLPDFSAEQAGLAGRVGEELDRIKWLLWHGNTFRAEQELCSLEMDVYTEVPTPEQAKFAKYLAEFTTYITKNASWIPNYGERHRCGEPISSAFAESTVNQVISKRMVKKQQMRWSPQGAHLFLQVRTRVLNDDLAADFARWYPGFTHHSEPVQLAA